MTRPRAKGGVGEGSSFLDFAQHYPQAVDASTAFRFPEPWGAHLDAATKSWLKPASRSRAEARFILSD
jgi:hypothetical protein